MKEIHNYLALLGFDLGSLDDTIENHFGGHILTDSNKEVKMLYIHTNSQGNKLLVMDIFTTENDPGYLHPDPGRTVIAKQKVPTAKKLRKHMLNSYDLKRLCPVLYQKVVETPA